MECSDNRLFRHQFTYQIKEIHVSAFPDKLNGGSPQKYQGVFFHTVNLSFIPRVLRK